jgi:lipid II:glycine glycyltransferase (peptidoglycan interpeptide bridge formation enzyme)
MKTNPKEVNELIKEQEELFYKWKDLKYSIDIIASILQNPINEYILTSSDKIEWKNNVIKFTKEIVNLTNQSIKLLNKFKITEGEGNNVR